MVIVGIILAYAVYQMSKAFYLDGDIMWHYKTGGYILSHLSVPKHDIFSWQPNLTWMPHEWLHDVYLYLFYSTFGYLSIALSFVINKEGVPPIIDHILFSMGALVAGCLWWGICFLLKKGLQKGSILTLNLVKKWRRDK